MSAKTMLKRLERKANSGCFADVLSWIRAGRFYDELTEEEQKRYCQYQYGEGIEEPPDGYFSKVFGLPFDYHFRLEYKKKPLTEAEIRENVSFLDEYMTRRIAEVNCTELHQKP